MKGLWYYCDHRRHLVCLPYSVANLHQMAATLGIKRCWFHAGNKPHYDIPKTRIGEIQARCKVVSSRHILQIIQGQFDEESHADGATAGSLTDRSGPVGAPGPAAA